MPKKYLSEKSYSHSADEKRPFFDEEKNERESQLPTISPAVNSDCRGIPGDSTCEDKRRAIWVYKFGISLLCCVISLFWIIPSTQTAETIHGCAWKYVEPNTALLDVKPISRAEFLDRQKVLAAAISEAGVDAFIAEPSASSTYYANISSAFELSERPFLMILDKEGQFSYLVPKFEAGRIAGLDMVYESKVVIEWHEEESPYEILKRVTNYKKVMIDEHVRFMIAAGLEEAGISIVPTSEIVQSIRAVKTDAELAILRGVNQFTVELVRGMQKCIKIGSTQEMVFAAAKSLFDKAGEKIGVDLVKGYWAIVLFGANAANPHGGSKGAKLKDGEFVLVDIGTSLHEYGSDVTRTFLPTKSTVSEELMNIWNLVYDAQSAAIELMKVNETCSVVDGSSRNIISSAGYGEFFTHRLGHGLGLEMHEHPYLNGANKEKLKAGQVVTNEPGIYVTTEQARKLDIAGDVGFGVRIEDAVLVTPGGGLVMTGSRAKSPYEP